MEHKYDGKTIIVIIETLLRVTKRNALYVLYKCTYSKVVVWLVIGILVLPSKKSERGLNEKYLFRQARLGLHFQKRVGRYVGWKGWRGHGPKGLQIG